MIYLFESELGVSIVFDASSLNQELKDYAVKVVELPTPEIREGFYSVLHCNHSTNEVWFEYIERPIVIEEVVEEAVEPIAE